MSGPLKPQVIMPAVTLPDWLALLCRMVVAARHKMIRDLVATVN